MSSCSLILISVNAHIAQGSGVVSQEGGGGAAERSKSISNYGTITVRSVCAVLSPFVRASCVVRVFCVVVRDVFLC